LPDLLKLDTDAQKMYDMLINNKNFSIQTVGNYTKFLSLYGPFYAKYMRLGGSAVMVAQTVIGVARGMSWQQYQMDMGGSFLGLISAAGGGSLNQSVSREFTLATNFSHLRILGGIGQPNSPDTWNQWTKSICHAPFPTYIEGERISTLLQSPSAKDQMDKAIDNWMAKGTLDGIIIPTLKKLLDSNCSIKTFGSDAPCKKLLLPNNIVNFEDLDIKAPHFFSCVYWRRNLNAPYAIGPKLNDPGENCTLQYNDKLNRAMKRVHDLLDLAILLNLNPIIDVVQLADLWTKTLAIVDSVAKPPIVVKFMRDVHKSGCRSQVFPASSPACLAPETDHTGRYSICCMLNDPNIYQIDTANGFSYPSIFV
jgi:hypothetical protein